MTIRDPHSEPRCTFFCEFRIELAAPQSFGTTARGERRIVPILGGTFSGPEIQGKISPGGSDWQLIFGGDVMELVAKYALITDRGENIAVQNGPAYRYGEPGVIAALMRGEAVDPASYYTCGSPQFETGSERLRWINYHRFVSKSLRQPASTTIRVYRVD